MARQRLSKLWCIGLLLVGTGCTTTHYLFQAARGQLELSNRARPVEEVLRDERTSPRVKRLLKEIPSVRSYAESYGLKPTSNYREYVQLDRPYVVYVVSASDRLKFLPRTWSFPLVGGFTYLGWFDEENARDYADKVELEEDVDVDVRGASAYSTLGWFRDPVLSTMISKGDQSMGSFVNTLIHESVHATFYIDGQSYFNESVAGFVADQLTPLYLKKVFGKGSTEESAYLRAVERGGRYRQKMKAAYERLELLYSSSKDQATKQKEKSKILSELNEALSSKRSINNASLVQYRTYGVGQEEWGELLRRCQSDWNRFWTHVQTLNESSFSAAHQENLAPIILGLAPRCSSS